MISTKQLFFVSFVVAFTSVNLVSSILPSNKGNSYFHLETKSDETSIGFPILKSRININVKPILWKNEKYCPFVQLSASVKGNANKPNICIVFCQNYYSIFDGLDKVKDGKYQISSLNDQFLSFWIDIAIKDGKLLVGWIGDAQPFEEYFFAKTESIQEDFFSHVAFGGKALWMVEKRSAYVIGEAIANVEPTSFFLLRSEELKFGIKFSQDEASSCPRIEFFSNPIFRNTTSLSFFFCWSTYGISNGTDNLIEEKASLVNENQFTGYWVRLDQFSGIISVGKNSNSTPFFTYTYRKLYKKFLFSYFAFVGPVQFILTNGV